LRLVGFFTVGVELRKSRGVAVSVGAVGGAGGAGGAGGVSGAGAGAGGVGGPGGGPSSSQAVTPSAGAAEVGEHSVKDINKSTDDDKKSMGVAPQAMNINTNNNVQMSTQDFMQLRQTSSCNEMQDTSMIDFKKIIEMMMAIQLLKAMNENSGQ